MEDGEPVDGTNLGDVEGERSESGASRCAANLQTKGLSVCQLSLF